MTITLVKHCLLYINSASRRGGAWARMCGIIGLHLKNPGLRPRLGELLTQMLEAMTTRGPDSAGIAVYADHHRAPAGNEPGNEPRNEQGQEQELRYSLRSDELVDW